MLINMGIWVFLYNDTKLWSSNICKKERNYIYIYCNLPMWIHNIRKYIWHTCYVYTL